jgi:hypothetical protein
VVAITTLLTFAMFVGRVVFKKDEKDGEKKQIPQSQIGKK